MGQTFNYFLPVYKNLEEEVLTLSKYVQINDDQLKVYSAHIADLIVRSSTEIEAISKALYWKNGGAKKLDNNGKERDLYFDTDCIAYLNDLWNVCDKQVIVSSERFFFEKEENIILKPLHKANIRKGALWNKAYQAVKHDRKESIKAGNVKNLIHALGALYILNLYYSDKLVELGVTHTPEEAFDSRMGSAIFSAYTVNATIGIKFGVAEGEKNLPDELAEECKKAIYIIRYKKENWERINKALSDGQQSLLRSMIDSGAMARYYQNHPEDLAKLQKENIMSLACKVLEPGELSKSNWAYDFTREVENGRVEVALSKNEPVY